MRIRLILALALAVCLIADAAAIQRVSLKRVKPSELRAAKTRPYLKERSFYGSHLAEGGSVPLHNFLDAQVGLFTFQRIRPIPITHSPPALRAIHTSQHPMCSTMARLALERLRSPSLLSSTPVGASTIIMKCTHSLPPYTQCCTYTPPPPTCIVPA